MAAALRRAGTEPFICPLLEVTGRNLNAADRETIRRLDHYDHLVFISRNAVRLGMAAIDQYWPQLPMKLAFYAVGQATARELGNWDLQPVLPDEATSEGLLALPALTDVAGQRVLIVRGVGGRPTLVDTLTERGALVDYLEVYERRSMVPGAAARRELMAFDGAVVLIYSGETLAAFSAALGAASGNARAIRARIALVVPSKRIEDLARDAGFDLVQVAESAEDPAMLEAALSVLGH
ncbi:MAG: uroporphyrinogen-III synthase [Pseudomonadales bacterium]